MFIFRADGNKKIGAGHIMRCLTIAEALRESLNGCLDRTPDGGEDIVFVCADEDSAALARQHGFPAKVLGTDYRNMEEELGRWQAAFLDKSAEASNSHIILVDSYYVTDHYLQELKNYGKVVLLDDMQRKAYPVDVVVNYNAFASEDKYRELYHNTAAKICVGSRYVPIRRQFWNRNYCLKDSVERVLITTGGGDVDNIAGKILEAIMPLGERKINYDLIIGRYNPHYEAFEALARENPHIHIHHDVQDMAGLMEACDVAITAGGTTIYELACVGVPFICFSYAENQQLLTEYIGEQQIAGYAGAYHRDAAGTLESIRECFKKLVADRARREAYSERERKMIDGRGAGRIVADALE